MLPIQRKISPYNHYEGNNIRYIVIHYVGATDCQIELSSTK